MTYKAEKQNNKLRRDIEIKDNIWWQEALEFVSFPIGSDVYQTGYWNGTGEKVTK